MDSKRLTSLVMLRHMHNKTQTQIAGELGVSKATYSAWETGRIELGARHLINLSKCLNCTPNDILGYHESSETRLPLDSGEEELLTLYRSLPPNIRDDIMDIMRTTVKGWRIK